MAKQSGVVTMRGSIGNLTFYKTQDGYFAKEKGSVDRARIKNDPAFQASRDSSAEFGRASSAASVLRRAFGPLLQQTADNRVISRLTKQIIAVIRADLVNRRGERDLSGGDLNLLRGFDFNVGASLAAILQAPYRAEVDRESGKAVVSLPAFVPGLDVLAPAGATHLKFVSSAAAVNFMDKSYETVVSESELIAMGSEREKGIELTAVLPAGSVLPLFLAFGVGFYQQVNGVFYPLNGGTSNALAIVSVNAGGTEGLPQP